MRRGRVLVAGRRLRTERSNQYRIKNYLPTHCIYQSYSDPTQPTADWSRVQTFGTVSQPEIWSRLRFGRGSQFWSRSQSGPRLTSLQELPITQLRQDNATGHQRRRYSQRYSRVGSTRRCGLLLLWPVINDSAPVNVDLAISLYHILDTMSVCLSVCPRAYLGNHSPIFGACHLRPWLGSHFAAMRYVMYFRFCWWRHALSHPRYGLIPFTYLFHRWRCGTLLSNYERLMTSLWFPPGRLRGLTNVLSARENMKNSLASVTTPSWPTHTIVHFAVEVMYQNVRRKKHACLSSQSGIYACLRVTTFERNDLWSRYEAWRFSAAC